MMSPMPPALGTPVPARHIVPVIESQSVGSAFHRLRLACAPVALAARAGQFVHVLPRLSGASETHDPLLRRAFSIMSTSLASRLAAGTGQPGEATDTHEEWIEILFRVGGRGTSLLARSREGDALDVLGPLGNGFGLEGNLNPLGSSGQTGKAANTDRGSSNQGHRPLLLVGGGIGVPPLIFAAQIASVSRETSGLEFRVEAFIGARNESELVGMQALQQAGVQVQIATDDGSQGQRGLVTAPLEKRLQEIQRQHQADARAGSHGSVAPLVCACGPWPMLKAVAELCARLEVECRVSLEESMPCGVGVCNGCVVPVLQAPDDYGRFRRICVQGPVLDARIVDWDVPSVAPCGPSQPESSDDSETPEHTGASQ